ncbi:hypothetical protein EVAR_37695_1 [Eumeta japonica]|uniref:Uncharacterized protein n=1 Tax=Eumeta variegata TaxID=151549 RepID=A0A4C1XRA7_EUMVA|nr:hypothetical protein EVAR_37695_1 [Eumeta japonica]
MPFTTGLFCTPWDLLSSRRERRDRLERRDSRVCRGQKTAAGRERAGRRRQAPRQRWRAAYSRAGARAGGGAAGRTGDSEPSPEGLSRGGTTPAAAAGVAACGAARQPRTAGATRACRRPPLRVSRPPVGPRVRATNSCRTASTLPPLSRTRSAVLVLCTPPRYLYSPHRASISNTYFQ